MNSPEDNSWSASSSITFSATCTDDADIASVSLYGDWGGSWALIDTHSDPNNGQPVSFTQTLPEGHWTWAIECTDNAAQTVTSSIRTLHVDTTPQMWWHSGYSYRKRLIVIENAGPKMPDTISQITPFA
jgi:myosin-crossreactive antigen